MTNEIASKSVSNLPPTIDDLTEMTSGPIFVRNSTPTLYPKGADIFITVYVGNQNNAHILTVPLAWKPFNLTDQAPRQSVLGSQHFLKAVRTGALTLLNAQEALKDLATPRAVREEERLRQLQASVEAAIRNPNADEFKLTLEGDTKGAKGGKEENERVNLNASFFDEGAVGASFKAWVTKTNSMDSDNAIDAAQVRGDFTVEELQYFAEETVHNRIRKGLKSRLQAMATKRAENDE